MAIIFDLRRGLDPRQESQFEVGVNPTLTEYGYGLFRAQAHE
jgi:hypothetical protein